MKVATRLTIFIIALVSISLLHQCSNPSNPSPESTPVQLKLSTANAPADVVSITGELSRSGYETLTSDFTIFGDTAVADFGEIAVGAWHLTVTAYSSSMEPLYEGETDVVISGGTLNVVHLTLEPTTGTLQVVVTWGDGNTGDVSGEFIYMHSSYNSQYGRALFRYNFQTDGLEQLDLNNQASYPRKIPGTNQLGYISRSSNQFISAESNGALPETIFSLPEQMMGTAFSGNGVYLFYYTWSSDGNRHLKKMDYPYPDTVTPITDGVEFDDSAPIANFEGDSVLFQSNRYGIRNAYLLDTNSGDITALTEYTNLRVFHPDWSNNSAGFFYGVRDENSNISMVKYQSLSTGISETIYSGENEYIVSFAISPDDSKVALLCAPDYASMDTRDLYIYDIDTQLLTQVTTIGDYFGRPFWLEFE